MRHFLKNYEVDTTYEAATLALQDIMRIAGFDDVGVSYEVVDQSDQDLYPWVRFEGDDDRYISAWSVENYILGLYKVGNVVTASSYIYGVKGVSVIIKKSPSDAWYFSNGWPFLMYTHVDSVGTYVGTNGKEYSRTDYVKLNDGTILPANGQTSTGTPVSFDPMFVVNANDYTPISGSDRVIAPYIIAETDGASSDVVYVSGGLPNPGSTANIDGKDMIVSWAFNSKVLIIDEMKDV